MGSGIRGLLVAACLHLLMPQQAHAWDTRLNRAPSENSSSLIHWCESISDRVNQIDIESDALTCANFYFFNQGLELENELYEKMLRFLNRAIEINPNNFETQTTAIWLHYSRWCASKRDSLTFGHYANEQDVTHQLINEAENRFFNQPVALQSLADHLYLLVQFYEHSLFVRIEKFYMRAQSLSRDPRAIVRCRINIAHMYREHGDKAIAIQKYKWALEIDPVNKIALKYLRQLQSS